LRKEMTDSGGKSIWARYKRADSTLIAFSLIGSTLVIFAFLALATITATQLADLPFLIQVATDSRVINSILLTFGAGLTAVFILLILGTPLAYVLARTHSRVNSLVEALIDIPLMLPHTVAGIMVYLLFMQRGLLGAPFKEIGIVFEDAFPGIVVAMLFVSMPFYINTVREGFEKVPLHIENVARTLGATRFRAFVRIVLPLSVRHLLNGSVLAWGRAISEFAAVIMIAYYPMIVSTLIYYRFTTGGLKESTAIAFLMILASFSIFLVLRIITRYLGSYDDRV
jgi:molybdate/tungstate transport system permease protein